MGFPRAQARPWRGHRLGWRLARALLGLLLVLVLVGDRLGGPSVPVDGPAVAEAAPEQQLGAVALHGPTVPESLHAAPAAGPLDDAELARRAGEYDRAALLLRDLAGGPDRAVADEALLQLAIVQIEAGRPTAAAETASELLGRDLDGPARARALFVLGRARRAADDCQGAIAAFDEAPKAAPDFGPYADLQAAYCYARLDDRAAQNDRAGKALAAAEARLTKIDALEHQVSATIKLGDLGAAIAASEQLLALAGTRSYRAQTLTSLGAIARDAARPDLAVRSFTTVVSELPDTPAAVDALDALRGLDALGAVAPDEPGAVLYFAGRHADAAAALRAALAAGLPPERAARARFYLGHALLRLDATEEGVAALRQVAADLPGSDLAARALLRAGQRLEAEGRLSEATDLYQQAAEALPSAAASQQAHAELVRTLVRRGATPEALQSALALADSGAEGRWKGLGLLWAGIGLNRAGDRAQGAALLARAADVDLDGYGGLRARAILTGDTRAVHQPATLDLAVLAPGADDVAALDRWLAGRGLDAATLAREQAEEPAYRRAGLLYRVGLPEWAAWELQELAARWQTDAGRLYGLARFAMDQGDTTLSMRFALAAQKLTSAPIAAQPRLLQQLIYPLPYADTIAAQANARNVDPLLFAALVRQESAFNPRARSSANALGLAQVIPSTGQGIAAALGRPPFDAEELYRPAVAIEFGTFYLSRQLANYQGRIFPALAAYNAGGGAVNRWLAQFGGDDPDQFAEQIPYAETSYYVKIVYENYQHYRRLYR